MQQNGQLNYGVVTSLPKSNSLNETILFPTTTRIQTASILTEFDENPDLKHAAGQPKRWELCWGFSVKVQTATNTLAYEQALRGTGVGGRMRDWGPTAEREPARRLLTLL